METVVKHHCRNTPHCFTRRVEFSTFSYDYCTTCKVEVTEEYAERMAIQNENINTSNSGMVNGEEDSSQYYPFSFHGNDDAFYG